MYFLKKVSQIPDQLNDGPGRCHDNTGQIPVIHTPVICPFAEIQSEGEMVKHFQREDAFVHEERLNRVPQAPVALLPVAFPEYH